MKITSEMGLLIVDHLMSTLDYDINIMDDHGIIVASSDASRLYQRHQGAEIVLSTRKELIVTNEDTVHLKGTKSGVNLPIEFKDDILGVVGITGNPGIIHNCARILKVTVETLLIQMYLNNQTEFQQNVIEGWMRELIDLYEFDPKKLDIVAESLSIDINVSRAALLVRIQEAASRSRDMKQHGIVLKKMREVKNEMLIALCEYEPIISNIGDGQMLFLADASKQSGDSQSIAEKLAHSFSGKGLSVCIGIGSEQKEIAGYRKSYLQAQQSLKLMNIFKSDKAVAHIHSWGIIDMVDYIPECARSDYIARYSAGYDQLNTEIIGTLRTFLESDLNVKEAAGKLHIHRNTLLYRLDKVYEVMGLDPKKFNDAVILKMLDICGRLNA